jgi:hypothetical protein
MTVKRGIPLKGDRYYPVENRQPIGFDRVLPDSGLLILKVDPNAPQGYGTVKVINADKDPPIFPVPPSGWTGTTGTSSWIKGNRSPSYPFGWKEKTRGVLITTPEKSNDALKAR